MCSDSLTIPDDGIKKISIHVELSVSTANRQQKMRLDKKRYCWWWWSVFVALVVSQMRTETSRLMITAKGKGSRRADGVSAQGKKEFKEFRKKKCAAGRQTFKIIDKKSISGASTHLNWFLSINFDPATDRWWAEMNAFKSWRNSPLLRAKQSISTHSWSLQACVCAGGGHLRAKKAYKPVKWSEAENVFWFRDVFGQRAHTLDLIKMNIFKNCKLGVSVCACVGWTLVWKPKFNQSKRKNTFPPFLLIRRFNFLKTSLLRIQCLFPRTRSRVYINIVFMS